MLYKLVLRSINVHPLNGRYMAVILTCCRIWSEYLPLRKRMSDIETRSFHHYCIRLNLNTTRKNFQNGRRHLIRENDSSK